MTPCIGLNKVNTADLLLSPALVRMEALRFPVASQSLIRDSGTVSAGHCLDSNKELLHPGRALNYDLHDVKVPRAAAS